MITIAAPLLLAGIAAAQAPGLWFVGYPSNGTGSTVLGLSQDGSVAVGGSNLPGGAKGFRWTRAGGREDFGLEPGMPVSNAAYAVDSTGQTIVGRGTMGPGLPPADRAFRRVGNGPPQNLGILPGEQHSFAHGVSGNGTIVVGYNEHSEGPFNGYGEAFRWTEVGGMQGLGYLRPDGTVSRAYGISRDGTTIVGYSVSGGLFGDAEAFRWTAGAGMELLPNLPGAPYVACRALAVNADGSIAVGYAPSGIGPHAVRWSPSGIQDLGIAPGTSDSYAWSVSDDGEVVGGIASDAGHNWAILWTPGTGMTLLTDFLKLHGINAPSQYRLEEVRAISGDGLTFAGMARHLPTNRPEGFVATIPAPGTAIVLLVSTVGLVRRGARPDRGPSRATTVRGSGRECHSRLSARRRARRLSRGTTGKTNTFGTRRGTRGPRPRCRGYWSSFPRYESWRASSSPRPRVAPVIG